MSHAPPSSAPRVSVVIPVLNGERYIERALNSVLVQTYRDFEVIAVNDGSTDRTGEILATLARRDPRIRIITSRNNGTPTALNMGLLHARGTYIARMDGDDIARPDRFEKQVRALDRNPDLGAIGSFVEYIDEADRPIRIFEAPTDHHAIDRANLETGNPHIWHPAVMLRASALRQIGGYDETYRYGQDYDLWLRLAEVTSLANLPEPLLRYRVHLGSVSVAKRDVQLELGKRAFDSARARRGLTVVPFPRQNTSAESELQIMRKWAWWALKAGNVETARHYAWRGLQRAPLSRASWALCLNVLRPSRVHLRSAS